MKNHYITFRSITFAQRGERILKQAGKECILRRTPKVMAQQGCGYSLQLQESDFAEAVSMLKSAQIPMGKAFQMDANAALREIFL